jgi:hypothetical protein
MTVRAAITRLSRLKVTLQNAWTFYFENLSTYETMAKSIAHSVLIALPPPGVEPQEWQRSVDTVMTRINAFLVATSRMNGFILRLATDTMGTGDNTGTPIPGTTYVSVADIVRWVEAGRPFLAPAGPQEGEGKRLDHRDFGKSNEQVAFNILYAVRKGTGDAVMAHVNQFMGKTNATEAHDRSPEIMRAWIDALVPRVRADLEAWVRAKVAAA